MSTAVYNYQSEQARNKAATTRANQALADSWADASKNDMSSAAYAAMTAKPKSGSWQERTQSDKAAANIAAYDEIQRLHVLCYKGDKSACEAMRNVKYNAGISQSDGQTVSALGVGAYFCVLSLDCGPLEAMTTYTVTTAALNKVTGQDLGQNIDAPNLVLAGGLGAANGWLGGLESIGLKFLYGGDAAGAGDLLSQKANGTTSVPEWACAWASGAVQGALPELKKGAQVVEDVVFNAVGYKCNQLK